MKVGSLALRILQILWSKNFSIIKVFFGTALFKGAYVPSLALTFKSQGPAVASTW